MRKLWVAVFLIASAGAARADAWQDIRDFCTAQWPAPEYQMQAHCVKLQEEAAMTVYGLMKGEASSGDMNSVLAVCVHDWESEGRQVDWRMAAHCYKRQREAFGWLEKRQADMQD